jgi:hypothetical protein
LGKEEEKKGRRKGFATECAEVGAQMTLRIETQEAGPVNSFGAQKARLKASATWKNSERKREAKAPATVGGRYKCLD